MNTPKTYEAIFLKKEKASEDVWTFYFDRTQIVEKFLPGQHLKVKLPFIDDVAENNRLFSISSSPLETDILAISVKEGISTFKKELFKMENDTTVKLEFPLGSFTFDLSKPTTSLLLSGGVGITPFFSMLKTVENERLEYDIILLASFSTPEKMLFYDELKAIEKKNEKIKVIYTLSQRFAKNWSEETGRIDEKMILKYVPDLKANYYYISGGIEFISGIADMLLSKGVTKDQGKIEQFIGL